MARYNPNVIVRPSDEDELVRYILDEVDSALMGLRVLHTNIAAWNNQYEGVLPPKSTPWKGCANLHIPLISWQTDTIVSNVSQTVFGAEPAIGAEPQEGGDDKGARDQETWLGYLSRRAALRTRGKEFALAACKHGVGIAKLIWDRWEEKLRALKVSPTGKETITEKTVIRDGPRLDLVPLVDFVMVPVEALSIGEAVGVGDRKRLRIEQIRRLEGAGHYLKGTTEKLKDMPPESEAVPTEVQSVVGIDPNTVQDRKLAGYERWELIWELPLRQTERGFVYDPKKGEARDVLMTIIRGVKPVLARCILYPWFHNRRHYIPFRILQREASFWGRSVCQILSSLQDEINAEHNQRIDYRSMLLNRPLIRRRGAKITDAEGQRRIVFSPGGIMDVDDPRQDLRFLDIPATPQESYMEEALGVGYAERATGVTEAKLGKIEPGAKTLGEIEITEAAGNTRFDDMVATFQGEGDFREGSGLKELVYQLMGLSVQFATPEERARVLGHAPVEGQAEELDLEDMIGAYDYIPRGNTLTSNPQSRKSDTVLWYREMLQNPIVQQDPTKLWAVTRDLCDAFQKKNVTAYIGSEEDMEKVAMAMAQRAQAEAAQAEADRQAQGVAAGVPTEEGAEGDVSPEIADALEQLANEEIGNLQQRVGVPA